MGHLNYNPLFMFVYFVVFKSEFFFVHVLALVFSRFTRGHAHDKQKRAGILFATQLLVLEFYIKST